MTPTRLPSTDSGGAWLEIVAPRVMSVHASIVHKAAPHLDWIVEYAPDAEEDTRRRFIAGRLEASTDDATVMVEVGALAIGDMFGTLTDALHEAYAARLAEALSLDVVLDLARITARGLLGTLGVNPALPAGYPDPDIRRMVVTDGAGQAAG